MMECAPLIMLPPRSTEDWPTPYRPVYSAPHSRGSSPRHAVCPTLLPLHTPQGGEFAAEVLLKPFDAARLHQALERARRASGDDLHAKLGALLARLGAPARPLTRVLVRSAGRMSFVRVDEVDWIEAADNYLRLHVGREEHLIRETLAGIESRLDPRRFVRIHRSAIVNLDRVTELRALFHGDHELLLKTGAALPVGRNYRERLMAALGG
jgi:two-component system, LytTR family, response regulator